MPADPTSRAHAEALDADDELAAVRDLFVVDDDDLLYLDGNSLGRMPVASAAAIQDVATSAWGRGLVRSWDEWASLPQRAGAAVAQLVGADADEVVVCDSTSVNLFKAVWAALDLVPDRPVIVTDDANFPTDGYVLQGIAERRGGDVRLVAADPAHGVTTDAVAEALAAGDVGVVSLSLVDFRSAALADLGAITAAAHRAGALVVWDLSHAVGAVPVDLRGADVDLSVGCTYKYLNAGPGAPAFVYARRDLHDRLRQPIQGWWGRRDQFAMARGYVPADGVDRFCVGTPPILSMTPVLIGATLLADVGIERLRAKSVVATTLAIDLFDAWLAPLGCTLGTPRDPARRGSHVNVRHPEAWRLTQALLDVGVVPDFREPDGIRFGFAPAYGRFVDVWDALDRLRSLVEAEAWTRYPEERRRVT